jgi:ParB-like chromosome segregation protein Spo0J
VSAAAATPWPADKIERRAVAALIPYARNARKHGARQIGEIAGLIAEFGWTNPILIDEAEHIIAGHGRVLAAQTLGIVDVPVVVARGWSQAQKAAYTIADNQTALNSTWNKELLRVELADLHGQGVDLATIGFDGADLKEHTGTATDLPAALQLEPPREYALVMCADADEWERLKVALSLTPVRRGGYKKGSPFDDVGTQRVVTAAALLALLDR